MADYKHIRVTPAEEDDVVIVVGDLAFDPAPTDEEAAPSTTASAACHDGAEQAVAPEMTTTPLHREERNTYAETTLQDLRSARMSGMQKVIICVCVIGVLAFIAWYAFMR